MQIVINISDYDYRKVKDGRASVSMMRKAIENGTPLTEKTEYWIKHQHNGIGCLECPHCSVWFLWMHLTRNSYCPNCGKRLEVQT